MEFGRDGPHITHILFANDNIVFLEVIEDSMIEFRNILGVYEKSSGQKVNFQKSSIFFGRGVKIT